MCLGALAKGQACVPCGCKTQQYWTERQEAIDAGWEAPVPGAGEFAELWATFDKCEEALEFGSGKPIAQIGKCGVDGATNFCAGCVITTNAGNEEIRPIYDAGCPPTTTTTTTTRTTITTTTTTITTTTTTVTTITTTTTVTTVTTVTTTTMMTIHSECHCLFDGDTIPMEAWEAAGNPLYGSYCANWDSLPGTNGHKNDTECAPSDKCNKECNYINLPWCYVKDGCTGAVHSTSTIVAGAAVSYDMCGAPDCFGSSWDDDVCPGGTGCEKDAAKTCHCLFEGGTLPAEGAAHYGNPLYGTNCEEAWDEMPGTLYYDTGKTHNCFGAEGKKCTEECNWRHAHWCFVEKGCAGLKDDEVIAHHPHTGEKWEHFHLTKPGFTGEIGVSYEMCHYANCYGANFEANPECPFGEQCLTCGMVKKDFKQGGCCGHPEKHIVVHHIYHEIEEFPHHHHFPHDDDTHGHR